MAKFNDDLSDLDDDLDARMESGKHKAAPIISDIPSYKAPSAVLDTVEDDDIFEDDVPSGQFDDVKNRAKQKANSDSDMSEEDKMKRRLINAEVKVGLAVRLCKLGFKYLYKSFVQGKFAAKIRMMLAILTKKKENEGLTDEEKDNLIDLYALQDGIKKREEKYDALLVFEKKNTELLTTVFVQAMEMKNKVPSINSTAAWAMLEFVASPLEGILREKFLTSNDNEFDFDIKYQKYFA